MDYSFKDLIRNLIEIYQDDLTTISKKRELHIQHLRTIFQRCREYGISLNPKKSIFGVDKGKLLGHIIYKDGITIDPARVEAIKKIPLPKDKKAYNLSSVRLTLSRDSSQTSPKLLNPLTSY
jgi:hypothetical protein